MADVLGKGVHDGLVQVLDHAVVRAVDVNGHVGHGPGRAAVETGDRDRAETVVAGPGQRVHDVPRAAGRRHGDEHVTRPGLGLQLVHEDFVVADVVAIAVSTSTFVDRLSTCGA